MIDQLEEIYNREKDSWFRYALGMLDDHDDAADVLQDAFERMQKKAKVSTDIDNIKGYFFLVIRNRCYDLLNKRRSVLLIEDETESIYAQPDNFEDRDQVAILRELLKQLPLTQRSVILLKDIEGHTYDEVAELLNMDKNSIRVNLSIARKKLRKAFLELTSYELKDKR